MLIMLIDVGDKNITIDKLKTNSEGQLKGYKEEYASQTKRDIGVRELILFKSKSGKCQAIIMEELA